MTDYTLKFPDEATAAEVLEQLTDTHAIDVIGVIYKPTGEMLIGEDGEYPAMAPIDGWHVNLRGEVSDWMLAAFQAYMVEPSDPVRVWA